MALRLIEISVNSSLADDVRSVMKDEPPLEAWDELENDDRLVVRFALDAKRTGPVIDRFEQRLGDEKSFRLTISAVEAVLPRLSRDEDDEQAKKQEQAESSGATSGVSREELYNDVWDMTVVSPIMIATSGLSSIVAAVGMMRDNVAVIIGAMVIAPLLGPNVGLSLATTLADPKLLKHSLKSNIVGSGVALILAIVLGLVLTVDLNSEELHTRLQVSLSDIALALAAGAAGVLALTSGVAAALVGVMVAVALLPPLVAMGLMIGSGQWDDAGSAALLLATNVICVNLAGTVTFLVQGVGPLAWWEKDRARKMSWYAVVGWVLILAALVVVILLAGGPSQFHDAEMLPEIASPTDAAHGGE